MRAFKSDANAIGNRHGHIFPVAVIQPDGGSNIINIILPGRQIMTA
nr:hypothetical protein [Cronobacter turicensis]